MQFTKPFQGVPNGEIYPVNYQPGDECPPELESAATDLGAFENPEEGGAGADAVPSLAKPPRKPKTQ